MIIPTRDPCRSAVACLEGLLERTDRGALDIIVIDNDSKEDATRILLDRIEAEGHVRRLAMPAPSTFPRLQSRVPRPGTNASCCSTTMSSRWIGFGSAR